MKDSNVCIIGGGNIGAALALGLVRSGKFKPSAVIVTRRNLQQLEHLKKSGIAVSEDNVGAIQKCRLIILAVLPQQFDAMIAEIKPSLTDQHIIVSIISGISTQQIQKKAGNVPVLRAMPNTAIAIGESMTCIAAAEGSEQYLQEAVSIFDSVGKTVVIKEDLMTSATALCACGVAFFLRAIRAASQGGIEIGFHADEALKMAAQTAKGAAALLLHKEKHPESEIDRVTSPQGCTIAGLNEMEHQGFSSALIKGIVTSATKAKDLYNPDN